MSEKASPENQNSELITEGLSNFFLGTQRRKCFQERECHEKVSKLWRFRDQQRVGVGWGGKNMAKTDRDKTVIQQAGP